MENGKEFSRYPQFYQANTFTELSQEQLNESSLAFNDLISDLLLENMADVKQFNAIQDSTNANLLKKIVVDGIEYTVAIKDYIKSNSEDNSLGIKFRNSEIINREISVQRIDDGYGREFWSYRLGPDGVVRRWDGGNITDKLKREKELDSVIKSIPNSRLEEDMGQNNQPVSPDEIKGLREFIHSASEIANL